MLRRAPEGIYFSQITSSRLWRNVTHVYADFFCSSCKTLLSALEADKWNVDHAGVMLVAVILKLEEPWAALEKKSSLRGRGARGPK